MVGTSWGARVRRGKRSAVSGLSGLHQQTVVIPRLAPPGSRRRVHRFWVELPGQADQVGLGLPAVLDRQRVDASDDYRGLFLGEGADGHRVPDRLVVVVQGVCESQRCCGLDTRSLTLAARPPERSPRCGPPGGSRHSLAGARCSTTARPAAAPPENRMRTSRHTLTLVHRVRMVIAR